MQKWIRYRSVGYMVGRGLGWGCGVDELYPKQASDLGKYLVNVDMVRHAALSVCDDQLGIFADKGFDYAVVGERLGWVPDPKAKLKEIIRKIKLGGYLIVEVPICQAGEFVVNLLDPQKIQEYVGESGCWELKANYNRDGWLLQIYKKLDGKRGIKKSTTPSSKRACVCRYGALGDVIILTPLLKTLVEDGYEVTCNFSTYAAELLKGNPYVKNIVLQERDAIPNADLGDYWKEWQGDYQKYINLSESLEGKLLKVEGRRDYYTSNAWRQKNCNKNYYDWTLALGGYPEVTGKRGDLYFTQEELFNAKGFRSKYKDKFIVLWALNGSSHHKVYPLMEFLMRRWLEEDPRRLLMTTGDKSAQMLEFEHPQVVPLAGRMPIRYSLAMTKVVDLVVGPESVMINAAGCFDVPKIPLLSHSTHENLCKYFMNDYCLSPNTEIAKCYPCHQLHYSLPSCPQLKIELDGEDAAEGPACAMGAIELERLYNRLNEVEAKHAPKRPVE